jgi:hypothetical protein
MEENNPYAFESEDIVVWNGIICKYGSIKHLADKDDSIRKATDEDKVKYKTA